jgi:hypothetical protein
MLIVLCNVSMIINCLAIQMTHIFLKCWNMENICSSLVTDIKTSRSEYTYKHQDYDRDY